VHPVGAPHMVDPANYSQRRAHLRRPDAASVG
jgi:hypothetical protein